MPYIERDSSGAIVALRRASSESAAEFLPHDHWEVVAFLSEGAGQRAEDLEALDSSLIRVLEDLVDLLVEKNVILFTDLPEMARKKILDRKEARSRMTGDSVVSRSENVI